MKAARAHLAGLRTLRKRAGLSQRELASRVGCKRDDIGNWETRVLPEFRVIAKLAKAFGYKDLERFYEDTVRGRSRHYKRQR